MLIKTRGKKNAERIRKKTDDVLDGGVKMKVSAYSTSKNKMVQAKILYLLPIIEGNKILHNMSKVLKE